MIARPDEEANRAEIERDKSFRENVSKGIGTAVAIGTGAASARVLPFLSKYIPTDLAMKGLSKVSPKISDFLKRGQSMGLNVDEGIQYIRDSISPKEGENPTQEPQKPKDNRNIIEQYSPELHKFIADQVSSGRKPIEAAAIAQHDKRFSEVIKKLSKDHKTPWSSIIDSIYGTGQYGGAVNPPAQDPQSNLVDLTKAPGQFPNSGSVQSRQLKQGIQTPQANNSQGGQPGPGQQALMDILSKINQKLGQ